MNSSYEELINTNLVEIKASLQSIEKVLYKMPTDGEIEEIKVRIEGLEKQLNSWKEEKKLRPNMAKELNQSLDNQNGKSEAKEKKEPVDVFWCSYDEDIPNGHDEPILESLFNNLRELHDPLSFCYLKLTPKQCVAWHRAVWFKIASMAYRNESVFNKVLSEYSTGYGIKRDVIAQISRTTGVHLSDVLWKDLEEAQFCALCYCKENYGYCPGCYNGVCHNNFKGKATFKAEDIIDWGPCLSGLYDKYCEALASKKIKMLSRIAYIIATAPDCWVKEDLK